MLAPQHRSTLTETTDENLQVAQYLYVSKTEVNGADADGVYTNNAALADADGDEEEGVLDSI